MPTPEELRTQISNWLMESHYTIGTRTDSMATFHLTVNTPIGLIVDIVQPIANNDLIVIGAGYALSPDQIRRLRELREGRRDDLLWEIKFSLLLAQYGFQFLPPTTNIVEQVQVSDMC